MITNGETVVTFEWDTPEAGSYNLSLNTSLPWGFTRIPLTVVTGAPAALHIAPQPTDNSLWWKQPVLELKDAAGNILTQPPSDERFRGIKVRAWAKSRNDERSLRDVLLERKDGRFQAHFVNLTFQYLMGQVSQPPKPALQLLGRSRWCRARKVMTTVGVIHTHELKLSCEAYCTCTMHAFLHCPHDLPPTTPTQYRNLKLGYNYT